MRCSSLKPTIGVGCTFFAGKHFIGRRRATHCVGNGILSGLIIVIINFLVVLCVPVDEDTTHDAEFLRPDLSE